MIKKYSRFVILSLSVLGLSTLALVPCFLAGCASVDRALYNVETNWTPHVFVQTNIITVTNTNDSGLGSLRQAILNASPGDTIIFNLPSPACSRSSRNCRAPNKS